MAYLVCFAASTVLAYFANKTDKPKKFWLLSALSILIPVFLAGLRDYSIGIDVKNYLNMDRFWKGAIAAESLGAYLDYYISLGLKEPLFALFIGVIARVTGQYRVFLFLAHLVIVTSVYIGAFRLRNRVRPDLALLLFYLLYYNNSLNIIRQYMAVSLIFAVFADLEERKFVRYVIVVFVASLIHTTALLGYVPLVITLILYPKREINVIPLQRMVVLIVLGILGTICFIPMVKALVHIGVLGTKYNFYFKETLGRLSWTRTGLLFLEIVGLMLCYTKLRKEVPQIEYFVVHTVAFMCFQVLSAQIYYGHRLVVYFALVNNITLLMLPKVQKTKKLQHIWYLLIAGFCLYYWYYMYVAALSSETIPYMLGF